MLSTFVCNRDIIFLFQACKAYMAINTRLGLSLKAEGKQMSHSNHRPQKACTIYCKQVRTPEYTSAELYVSESDDVPLYFPDGTLCHNDGQQNYYCLKHQCVPGDQSRSPRQNNEPEVAVFQVKKPCVTTFSESKN